MGFTNSPTTADYAASDARDAQLTTQDCLVLIGWLALRVTDLEGRLLTPSDKDFPELPLSMQGFGCIPRRDEAVRDAFRKMRRQ